MPKAERYLFLKDFELVNLSLENNKKTNPVPKTYRPKNL